MPIIGVMGSGKSEWAEWAEPLGAWIGENHFDLLTGAGKGVMLTVSRAFCAVPMRKGRSIGIVPTRYDSHYGFLPLDGYPNPYIEIPILTPLSRREPDAPADSLSRNHVNILTSDVVIALPGGVGTLDEIRLACLWRKPIICFGPPEQFAHIASEVKTSTLLEDIKQFVWRTNVS